MATSYEAYVFPNCMSLHTRHLEVHTLLGQFVAV